MSQPRSEWAPEWRTAPIALRHRVTLLALLLIASGAQASWRESGFYQLMDEAMERMETAMHPRSTGNVDHDFAAMMIPHHQGAIDMAIAELRYGTNPQLRRIAQEIIVDQQQEIAVMKLATGASQEPQPAPIRPTAHERHRGH